MKSPKEHVEETFKGLGNYIKDKEVLDWYMGLIVDSIEEYRRIEPDCKHENGIDQHFSDVFGHYCTCKDCGKEVSQ